MIWLTVFIYHLIVYEYVFRSVKASWRSKRTVVGTYPVCPRGCTACSRVNGCITCEGSLFMFLYRHNMRETGICTPSCPVGYYGVRHQYYSKCYRCHIDHCHSCFDRNFCTMCDQPYLAIEGQCLEECPEGLYYANYTRECKERVDCLPGAWSPWSTCMRNGQTCGYRWGTQTRTQEILQDPSPNGTPCPEVTPTQRCRLRRRQCDGKCKGRRKHRKKNKHRRRRPNKVSHNQGGRRGQKWRPGGRRRNNRLYAHHKIKRTHRRRACHRRRCRRIRHCSYWHGRKN